MKNIIKNTENSENSDVNGTLNTTRFPLIHRLQIFYPRFVPVKTCPSPLFLKGIFDKIIKKSAQNRKRGIKMVELKIKDLFTGKMGIFMALMVILSVAAGMLRFTGIAALGLDVVLLPIIFDFMVIVIFLVAKYL